MAFAVDQVANVVQQTGHGGQFGLALRRAQVLQDPVGPLADPRQVSQPMIGVADRLQVAVGHLDQRDDFRVRTQPGIGETSGGQFAHLFIGDRNLVLFKLE